MKNRKWYIIGLSVLFLILTVLVKTNLTEPIDTFFYNLVTFKITDGFTLFYKMITFLGSTEFIVGLCILFLFLFLILKKKNIGFIITAVLIISTIINNLVKVILMRERPEVLSFVTEHSYSFPSGHTMAAVSMYGILIYILLKSSINKKYKTIISVIIGFIPIMVALSRVYLGAHFVTDVIGGIILSTILLLIETYYIDKKNWL